MRAWPERLFVFPVFAFCSAAAPWALAIGAPLVYLSAAPSTGDPHIVSPAAFVALLCAFAAFLLAVVVSVGFLGIGLLRGFSSSTLLAIASAQFFVATSLLVFHFTAALVVVVAAWSTSALAFLVLRRRSPCT